MTIEAQIGWRERMIITCFSKSGMLSLVLQEKIRPPYFSSVTESYRTEEPDGESVVGSRTLLL